MSTHPNAGYAVQPVPKQPSDAERKREKYATVSLILGLIGIVAWILPLAGFPVCGFGIGFGVQGMRSNKRGSALAGLVLSIIFLIVTAINSFLGMILGLMYAF